MHFVGSFITNPGEIAKFPFEMAKLISDFVTLIMQSSFNFATTIMKLVV